MSTVKLDGIDLNIYSTLKTMLLEQGFDQKKEYTAPEAAALYKLVTKCCAPGIVDYVNSLHLPEETVFTLQDIAHLARNQEGSDLFTRAVGLSGPDGDGKNVYGNIEIPNGKDGVRVSDNDASYSNTTIHQKNGYGRVTNFKVCDPFPLNVQVDTNTELELTNIKTGGNIDIHISSAALIRAGARADDTAKKADAISTSKKVKISIATCNYAYFGICADTIEVDQISTCNAFYLHAMEFNQICYKQSTCNHTYIFVPKGTKFKLTLGKGVYRNAVDCDESLIDDSAAPEKEIQINQLSTGIVHIKEEKVIF